MTPEQSAELRKEFPSTSIGKLPKAGITLDYVGHATVTDRLLSVDPEWTWEPLALDADGAPLIRRGAKELTMWIRLTVCGVTRLGVGSVAVNAFDAEKQLVGDALRNAAMRFGVALDLWSKAELESAHIDEVAPNVDRETGEVRAFNGPVCATCSAPLGTEPVRKSGGVFVHVKCPTSPDPGSAAATAPSGAAEGVERGSADTAPPSAPSRRSAPGESADANGGGPVPSAPVASAPRSARTTALMAAATQRFPERAERLQWAEGVLGRPVTTFGGLSVEDETKLLDRLNRAGAKA